MAKSNKHSRSKGRHPALRVLLCCDITRVRSHMMILATCQDWDWVGDYSIYTYAFYHWFFHLILHPIRVFFMSLVKILVLLLVHPAQVCTLLVVSVTAVYFFSIVDSFVALILPFKPFHLLYSHIKTSAKITMGTLITPRAEWVWLGRQ
jgi:hypothetical protein